MMPLAEARQRLDLLREHGFIDGWKQVGNRFWVDTPGAYRTYTRSEIGAWVDGANAMGAAPHLPASSRSGPPPGESGA
jgi:hypothetical protein